MNKIDLGILDNADEDVIEKLPPFSSDEATRKRVLSMSEKKFDKLMSEQKKVDDSEYEVSVSGVEIYRRPVWHRALGIAAAVALIAGGIGTAAALKHRSPKSGESMFGAQVTDEQTSAVPETSSLAAELPVKAKTPVIDIANDEIRFMATVYAPYLLDISAEQQQKLAAALNASEWTPCDVNEPLPEGQTFTMYVYNNGSPYSITLYGDKTVKLDGMGETTRWHIPDSAASAIIEAAVPETEKDGIWDETALLGRMTWCSADSINVSDIWKNTRAGARDCDMTNKDDVFFKMNNAPDYFDRASGTVKIGRLDYYASGCSGDSTKYDFQVDLNTAQAYQYEENYYGPSYEAFISGEGLTDQNVDFIQAQDGENYCSASLSDKTYYKLPGVKHRIDSPTVTLEELRGKNSESGTFDSSASRIQMLSGIAINCIENYRTAFEYLSSFDNWDIVGTEEVNGRVCVHINGAYQAAYDSITSFDLYLDEETGVTVRLKAYDASGRVVYFIETENLKFNGEAEQVKNPDLSGLTGGSEAEPALPKKAS